MDREHIETKLNELSRVMGDAQARYAEARILADRLLLLLETKTGLLDDDTCEVKVKGAALKIETEKVLQVIDKKLQTLWKKFKEL